VKRARRVAPAPFRGSAFKRLFELRDAFGRMPVATGPDDTAESRTRKEAAAVAFCVLNVLCTMLLSWAEPRGQRLLAVARTFVAVTQADRRAAKALDAAAPTGGSS
jgi:hypothetical protein